MTASLGIAAPAKHQEKQRQIVKAGQTPAQTTVSPGKATAALVVTLAIGAVVYHTVVAPQTGIYI
jgi:uncharacterized protein HemX